MHRAGDAFVRLPIDLRRSGCPSESHQPRALRTRCKQQPRDPAPRRQAPETATLRNLRVFLFATATLRSRLLALGRPRIKRVAGPEGPATRAVGSTEAPRAEVPASPAPERERIHRAGNAFVHLPEKLSASAYSPSGGFDLPAPRARCRRDCRPWRRRLTRARPNEFGANCAHRRGAVRRRPTPSRKLGSLTMSKLPDKGQGWLKANERRFEEKWGWVPAPTDPGLTLDEL
jgi:hypothetical protein